MWFGAWRYIESKRSNKRNQNACHWDCRPTQGYRVRFTRVNLITGPKALIRYIYQISIRVQCTAWRFFLFSPEASIYRRPTCPGSSRSLAPIISGARKFDETSRNQERARETVRASESSARDREHRDCLVFPSTPIRYQCGWPLLSLFSPEPSWSLKCVQERHGTHRVPPPYKIKLNKSNVFY